jgi:hypothetical protein
MEPRQNYSRELVHGQLEKVLSSMGFARNDRLSGFLRFVIEEELSGRGDQLKESIVGAEVFGRRPDYDVRQDSVVRTEAGKLRARLAEYYSTEGLADPLVIEVPKGGYKPAFRQNRGVTGGAGASGDKADRLQFRLWLVVGLASLAIAAAVDWWRLQNVSIPIAVLPLINLSQDPANDYFADGLTGELIRNLSILDGLTVAPKPHHLSLKANHEMWSMRESSSRLTTFWKVRY